MRPDAPALTDSLFRTLASSLSQVLWRFASDGRGVIAPRWAEITGKGEHELQRDGWLATIHPDDRGPTRDAWRQSVFHRGPFKAEFRLQLRDLSHHWFRTRGEPVRDPDGHVTAWVGVATNIDDEKATEALLVDSESRLRLVIDAARVGTFEHDIPSGTVHVNGRTLALLGLPSGSPLTFERFVGLIHPDDRTSFILSVGAARKASGDGSVDLVFRVVRPAGDTAWLSIRGRYQFAGVGPDRVATRFAGVAADVSERMQKLEERSRLSAIISSSDDAIVAKTLDGTVTHWNAAAERIFGFSAEEMLGQSFFRVVPIEVLEEERELLTAAQNDISVSGRITKRVRKDGASIDVSLTLSPIFNDAGECVGVSSITRDITAQRELEEQFRQAQKMEAVGQLAGGVAHDLNNILTSVLVGMEFALQSQSLEPFLRSSFTEVRADCYRASTLIRQLLTVARRQVINPRTCSPNDIVQDILPMISRLLGEDVGLETRLNANAAIFADPNQLGQVVLNLAVNARDAMPTGGHVTIETRDDCANHEVILSFSDTGPGIDPAIKARVFEPFFTTKAAGNGTGLGLSAAYGIVAQAGGTIKVESEPGQGAAFVISLPTVAAAPNARVGSRSSVVVGGSETILVVEDERIVRDLLTRSLRSLGYHVLEAQNGHDALIMLSRHDALVHLVLTDVVMPQMGGGELIERLRAQQPDIRVVFMSGYSHEAVENYGVLASNAVLLQKPFEMTGLAAAIRATLDGQADSG
jgi:two-component system, cell cycle sensor histidine kinase and response regulator CckA